MLPVKVVKVRLRLLLLAIIVIIVVIVVPLSAGTTGTTTTTTRSSAVLPESLFLTLLVLVGLVAHPVAPDVEHPNVGARPVDAPATLPVVHLHAEAVTPVEAVVPDVGLDLEPAAAAVLATGGRRRLRGLQFVVDG